MTSVINSEFLKIYLLYELNLKEKISKFINVNIKNIIKKIEENKLELYIDSTSIELLNTIRENIFKNKNKLVKISEKLVKLKLKIINFEDVSDCYKFLSYIIKISKEFKIQFNDLYDKLNQVGIIEFIRHRIISLMENIITPEKLDYIRELCNEINNKKLVILNPFTELFNQIQLFNLKNTNNENIEMMNNEEFDEKYKLIEYTNNEIMDNIKLVKRNEKILIFSIIFMFILLFGTIIALGVIAILVIFYIINSY